MNPQKPGSVCVARWHCTCTSPGKSRCRTHLRGVRSTMADVWKREKFAVTLPAFGLKDLEYGGTFLRLPSRVRVGYGWRHRRDALRRGCAVHEL